MSAVISNISQGSRANSDDGVMPCKEHPFRFSNKTRSKLITEPKL